MALRETPSIEELRLLVAVVLKRRWDGGGTVAWRQAAIGRQATQSVQR